METPQEKETSQINIDDLSVCQHCRSTGLSENDKYCSNCGFPQRGDDHEKKKFLSLLQVKKRWLDEHRRSINKARNILYILAGFYILFGIGYHIFKKDLPVLISCFMIGVVYLGLALWCRKNPFAAIVSGICVYAVTIVISAIDNPVNLFSGFIWKILIISGLIYGYKGAREAKQLEDELNQLQTSKDLSPPNELPRL